MEQWEYTVFALSWDRKAEEFRVSGELEFSATTMIDALNRIGESGWEIFDLSPFRGVSVLPGGHRSRSRGRLGKQSIIASSASAASNGLSIVPHVTHGSAGRMVVTLAVTVS